jgi:hypothetical protein
MIMDEVIYPHIWPVAFLKPTFKASAGPVLFF